jgi:hypothetical protein
MLNVWELVAREKTGTLTEAEKSELDHLDISSLFCGGKSRRRDFVGKLYGKIEERVTLGSRFPVFRYD